MPDEVESTRALVTGAAGFIGSTLVRQLKTVRREVVAVDNLERGKRENLPETWPESDFRHLDVLDTTRLTQCLEQRGIEEIYHLAALHYIPDCDRMPCRTVQTNVEGTQSVLAAATRAGVRRVFFTSTAAVYRRSDRDHREDDPLEPDGIYGLSKLFGERLVALWARQTAGEAVIGRFSNVIGPRETNPHLLPHILGEMRSTDRIALGNLEPIRDYIYVDEVCRGVLAATATARPGSSQVYNISSGEGASVLQLVEALAEAAGRPIRGVSVAERTREVDCPRLVLSPDKLTRATAWSPNLTLRGRLERLLIDEGVGIPEPGDRSDLDPEDLGSEDSLVSLLPSLPSSPA